MRLTTLLFVLSIAALGVLGGTSRAHALRCGLRLVTVGDRAHYVESVCGEPAAVTRRTVTRSRTVLVPIAGGSFVGDTYTESVEVETWLYDFGRRRFQEELVFEDGVLVRMQALGYGERLTTTWRPPGDQPPQSVSMTWVGAPAATVTARSSRHS